jgi:hypothetical protein
MAEYDGYLFEMGTLADRIRRLYPIIIGVRLAAALQFDFLYRHFRFPLISVLLFKTSKIINDLAKEYISDAKIRKIIETKCISFA